MKEELIQESNITKISAEKTLILGWNWRAPAIINQLDAYVPPGSSVTIAVDDASQSYGIVVNPVKSAEVTFTEHDRIIVLAES